MDENKNSQVQQPKASQYIKITGRGGGGHKNLLYPTEKPKDAKNTIFRLLSYFKGQIPKIILTLFLVIVTSMAALSIPLLSGKAIDALNENSDISVLHKLIFFLSLIYIADSIFKFTQTWIIAKVSQTTIKIVRENMFAKLQKLPIKFFDKYQHGELMSRLSNDTDNISSILGTSITHMMSISILLIGTIIVMLFISPIMTLFSVISMPLVFLLTKTVTKNTKKLFKEQQKTLGELNACVEENITGIHVVKAYSHEKHSIEQLNKINEKLCEVGTKAQIWSGYIMPIMNVINNLSFAIIAGAGGVLAVKGLISIGTIAIFINYSRQFGRPLNELASIYNSLQSALASAERVFEVLDSEEDTEDLKGAIELSDVKGEVEFQNVDFWYNEGEPVLNNISFKAYSGETIAFVGSTGAGKTTIVNLITRFYDVCSGKILLDGKDIEDYTRKSYKSSFGIVLQDTYLFTGTIRENICYGKQDANFEQVTSAAKAAGAHAFIKQLPKGYDTMLTESGQNISEGQRQLLAIARAILYDPAILILDEATSSVDTRTELKIQEAFKELMKGRTSFIIAHRLSTIIGADTIMLIQNGKLIESGSHTELMSKESEYKKMFEMQIGGI